MLMITDVKGGGGYLGMLMSASLNTKLQTSILFKPTTVKQINVYGMCTKSLFLKFKFKISCIFEGGGI